MEDTGVLIDKLAFGGNGVCRINGKVCFVPFSCPGDQVCLSVTSEKKSYCSARVTEVVKASPFRTTPLCPLFGKCGGCFWQHIEYPQQLAAKQQILAEALWRGARVSSDIVVPTLPSVMQYGYRSRVQFKVQYSKECVQIGFYRHGTHTVEELPPQGCPIANPIINEALISLRSVLSLFPDAASLSGIKVEHAGQDLIAIISYSGSDRRLVESFFQERRSELLPMTAIYMQLPHSKTPQKLYGCDELAYCLPAVDKNLRPCRLSYLPGGFSQVNRAQNEVMLALVRRMGCFKPDHQVLDLFCGNGNFSIPIAVQVGSMTGVEESQISIDAARANCRLNQIDNAEFICADAAVTIRGFADTGRYFDTIVLDPPRAGAAEVMPDICRLSPDRIIYVSCDPSTLARDCGLLASAGYSVEESVPVDMFPQTYHIESVTLLRKS
jgi:23S rRNA (uracil1939-C5)-methyltransferase